jgi:hypothetical protein
MNFSEVSSLEEAMFLAPVPQFASIAEERHHRQGQRRITIAEVDEQFMAQWEHPQDVVNMRIFWKEKQVERRAKRAGKRQRRVEYEAEYAKRDASTWSSNDEPWFARIEKDMQKRKATPYSSRTLPGSRTREERDVKLCT